MFYGVFDVKIDVKILGMSQVYYSF